MDVLNAEIRQVVFFDTPDLQLNAAGVVVRARRARRGGDTVVKLRPVVPLDLPGKLRRLPTFGVEVDAIPGAFVCSGSLKGLADNEDIRRATKGTRAIKKLYSQEQRDLFAKHAPDQIGFGDLVPLGPVNLLKLKFNPVAYPRKMVAEMWFFPDGSRILELSTKCLPTEAAEVAVRCRAFLEEHGVDLSGEQATKTKTALEYYSGLREAEPAPASA